MPDQLNLSLWLRGFDADAMLGHFEALLRRFPFSALRPGLSAFRVYALEFTEPALFEQLLGSDATPEDVLELAREFHNPDCAYLVEGWWDLWQYRADWELKPARVSLTCFGPDFENDVGDHLRLELGADVDFLPRPEIPLSGRRMQSNLQSVVRLAKELKEVLPIERRRLWTDSGESFAARLDEAVSDFDDL